MQNVLIIEDDPIMASSLQDLVDDWGFRSEVAANGKAGLKKLTDEPVDVVLSDIHMPGMSGEEVLDEALKRHPGIPFILLTAHGSVASAVASMKKGAFDYVLKPFEEDELRLTVERALEHARLRRENSFLRSELAAGGLYGDRLVGKSPKLLEVFELIERVAPTDSTVLITGETGTGKELIAQTIHHKSRRAEKVLVAVNCAALHENLLESELFGHEKGAFTGAHTARSGRFEDADGGTIFLDEIGETSTEFQAKLLRVLQEGELQRVGSSRTVSVDTRVIASTNADLKAKVDDGSFREDLYYRLRVVPIQLPPLRDRGDDILVLADHFLRTYAKEYVSAARSFSNESKNFLLKQRWEGNVRELQHTVERAVILARGDCIEPMDLTFDDHGGTGNEEIPSDLQDFIDVQTKGHVVRILDQVRWQKQKAADLLGIDRATLYRILKKHSIQK